MRIGMGVNRGVKSGRGEWGNEEQVRGEKGV